nr:MAG TPA: hypothetical protein [Caudoviricetes sp.]
MSIPPRNLQSSPNRREGLIRRRIFIPPRSLHSVRIYLVLMYGNILFLRRFALQRKTAQQKPKHKKCSDPAGLVTIKILQDYLAKKSARAATP